MPVPTTHDRHTQILNTVVNAICYIVRGSLRHVEWRQNSFEEFEVTHTHNVLRSSDSDKQFIMKRQLIDCGYLTHNTFKLVKT